jgi:hypothetical protein
MYEYAKTEQRHRSRSCRLATSRPRQTALEQAIHGTWTEEDGIVPDGLVKQVGRL